MEDTLVEIKETEQKKTELKSNEENLRELWNNVKHPNIRTIGVP